MIILLICTICSRVFSSSSMVPSWRKNKRTRRKRKGIGPYHILNCRLKFWQHRVTTQRVTPQLLHHIIILQSLITIAVCPVPQIIWSFLKLPHPGASSHSRNRLSVVCLEAQNYLKRRLKYKSKIRTVHKIKYPFQPEIDF